MSMIHRHKLAAAVKPSATQEAETTTESSVENVSRTAHTKNEINRMKTDAVVELAKQEGVDVEGRTSADLKKLLIEKLGL